jgi:DNA repair photolyase
VNDILMADNRQQSIKGRGASSNRASRYLECVTEDFDDGWTQDEVTPQRTEVFIDNSRSILSFNQSPDIPFDRSINPYKGCEHGCVYCFARPTHAYMDLSPGLDFETKIFTKPDAAKLLAGELARPGYRVKPIALGMNTDAWQPVERQLKITRQILEVLQEHQHPVAIVTKSSLIERDIDLLAPMAQQGLVKVMISVTSLDRKLCRLMEPRAAAPARRLQTIRALVDASIPTGVLFAPVIPFLNDAELETVLEQVSEAGACSAGYVMLRLPHELKELFRNWLGEHYPLKAEHVMNVVRDLRGGKDYNANFGERMTGSGEYANLIAQRFKLACRKYALNQTEHRLETGLFTVPARAGDQIKLF